MKGGVQVYSFCAFNVMLRNYVDALGLAARKRLGLASLKGRCNGHSYCMEKALYSQQDAIKILGLEECVAITTVYDP